MLRHYWQPVAMASEVEPGSAPHPVKIMGENLVLFRDDSARLGLLGLNCAHRGADLSYGRIEDGGLRCLYHGWLYDVEGRCLEQPSEPEGSHFSDKVRQTAYPVMEKAGVIFGYLGPGDPPILPAYEALEVADDHRWVAKYYHDCNYLQANEGNQDPSHPMFLHGFLEGDKGTKLADEHPKEDHVFRPAGRVARIPIAIDAEETDYGVRSWAMRRSPAGSHAAVLGNFVMPNLCAVQGGPGPLGDGYLIYWHVPIDDYTHYRYAIAFKRSGVLDPALGARRDDMLDEHFRFPQNPSNRYMQNREEMVGGTFAGFGTVFVVGDHWVTESAGPIQDRTVEHLGAADREITLARRMLLRAVRDVQEGNDPAHVIRSDQQNDMSHLQVWEESFDGDLSLDDFKRIKALPTVSRGGL